MTGWKRWVPVAAALAIALAITAVLTLGLFSGEGDTGEQVNVTQDKDRVPAPTDVNLSGSPPAGTTVFAGFENVADSAGFDYEATFRNRGLMSQSGLYVVDYDNDGDEDVLATGGTKPVLFKNTGSAFERARTFDHPDTRTAHFLDYDNDGWRDLVLAEYAGKLLFYENQNGSFERRDVGLGQRLSSPTSITSADFTSNGCLDLFVGVNGLWQRGIPLRPSETLTVHNNHPEVRPTTTPGGENRLFYGDCEGFEEATEQASIHGRNWTLAASAADFTGDGAIDIHVGNDFSADFLYVNQGNGTFERQDLGPKTDRNAMASVAKDVTGDGRPDLFITNIYMTDRTEATMERADIKTFAGVPEGNNLLVNTGSGSGEQNVFGDLFVDRAEEHGLDAGGWGWAAAVDDFTNDGHLDVVHGTSSEVPFEPYDRFRTPQVWQGTADSWEAVDERALGLEQHQARGMARLDFDNDGALDFAIATTPATHLGGGQPTPFPLYENQLESDQYLQLFVRAPNKIDRNAAVVVETDSRTILRRPTARAGFLSQDSRLIHVGLANEALQEVSVLWPDGTRVTYDSLEAGNRYILAPNSTERVD
jgi:hypothetical protein